MSLETVVEDIREEARARANEILAEADANAEEIIAEAEADATQIQQDAEAEVDQQIEQEREQKLSSAKLEAKQERLEARRNILQLVYENVREQVTNIEGERRKDLTEALLDDAAEEFTDASEVSVYGRKDDEDLINSLLEDRDGYEYGGVVECLGGVVVQSETSRVRVNNTFDTILESVWENNLREISDRLFER